MESPLNDPFFSISYRFRLYRSNIMHYLCFTMCLRNIKLPCISIMLEVFSKSKFLINSSISTSTLACELNFDLFLIIFIAMLFFSLWSKTSTTWPKLPFPMIPTISNLKAMWSFIKIL